MKYNFIKYTGKHQWGEDKITITSSKCLYFHQISCNKHQLDQFNYVSLFYDKENKIIGLRFEKEKSPTAYKLTKTNIKGLLITLKSFLNFYDLTGIVGQFDYKKEFIKGIGELFIIMTQLEKLND